MVKKTASASSRIDYSQVDIYVEEFKNIENHRPSMVQYTEIDFEKRRHVTSKIRIMPSKLWPEDPVGDVIGLLVHESLHTWLLFNFGGKQCMQMDNLPEPTNTEEFLSGVFGWNLNKFEWKQRGVCNGP